MASKSDNTLTKQDMIDKSYKMMNAEDLNKIYTDTTITGTYLYNDTWYKYIVNSFSNGTIEGQNNVGSYNEGRWKVTDHNTMSVEWDGYWEDWEGCAYRVNDEIMFFDLHTDKWRTTYTLVEDGELPTDV